MADAKKLQIILSAKDDLSPALRKTQKNLHDFSRKAGMAMTAFGAAMVGVGAFSLKAASDVEEMTSKFNVVFKESADEVREWAEVTADAMGRSKFAFMEMAASVQDTFVPMGFARKKAAELSKNLTELAVDVASFNNAQDKDVMRDFQSALVGNTETVRKYGIVLTAAAIENNILEQGLVETKSAITEQMKVQERFNMIMAGTADAQGDAIRTSDSFANQMKRMEAQVEEVKVAIGQHLLPVMADLVTQISGVIKGIADWMKENPALAGILTKIAIGVGALSLALGPLLMMLPGIVAAVPLLTAAFGSMLGPVGILTVGLGAISILAIGLANSSKTTAEHVRSMGHELAELAGKASETKAAIKSIEEEIRKIAEESTPEAINQLIELREELDNLKGQQKEETKAIEERRDALWKELAVQEEYYRLYKYYTSDAVNQSQHLTYEMIHAAESISTVWEGIFTEYLAGQGAAIAAVWDLHAASKSTVDAIDPLVDAINPLVDAIEDLAHTLASEEIILAGAERHLEGLQAAYDATAASISTMETELGNLESKLAGFKSPRLEGMQDAEDEIFKLGQDILAMEVELGNTPLLDVSMGGMEAMQNTQLNRAIRERREEIEASLPDMQAQLDLLNKQYELDFAAQVRQINETVEGFQGLNRESKFEDIMNSIGDTVVEMGYLNGELGKTRELFNFDTIALDAQQSIVDAMTGMVTDSRTELGRLKTEHEITAGEISAIWEEVYRVTGISGGGQLPEGWGYTVDPYTGASTGGAYIIGVPPIHVHVDLDGNQVGEALIDTINTKTGMRE